MGFGSGGGGFTPSPNNVPGSTQTGTDKDTDLHQFTGSVDITGSLTLNGSSVGGGGGGGTPGGANTQVQYNNAGSFAGSANFTFDGAGIQVSADADATSSLGRAAIGGAGLADAATISHVDHNTATNFGFRQRANGQTEINAKSDQSINLKLGSQNKLVLNSSGFVGIGENISPTAVLHVSSSASDPLLRVDHSTQAGAEPILFVSGSGLVGIGTDTPRTDSGDTNRLHIMGESGADQGQNPVLNSCLTLENNNHVGLQFMFPQGFAGQLTWGTNLNNRKATHYYASDNNRWTWEGRHDGGPVGYGDSRVMTLLAGGDSINIGQINSGHMITNKASLHISSSSDGTDEGGPVLLRCDHAGQSGAQPTLFVTGSGRVGIGTDTPEHALSVSGSAAFSGAFGSTAIETLTSAGALSVTDGVSIVDVTALANNATYSFTIPNGTFVGQQKIIYGKATAGASGADSNAISIGPSSNIDSGVGNVTGQLILSGTDMGGWQAYPRGGATLLWDGTKWITINVENFFWQ